MNPETSTDTDVLLDHVCLQEALDCGNQAIHDAVQRLLATQEEGDEYQIAGFSNFV